MPAGLAAPLGARVGDDGSSVSVPPLTKKPAHLVRARIDDPERRAVG